MTPVEIYVGFWPRSKSSIWSRLGHVEVWGYTVDNTWFFIDPRQHRTELLITHRHDEVEALLAHRFANCSEVWRLPHGHKLTVPLLGIFNCIGVAASIIGLRAYTFRGLRKRLRAIGAEKIHEGTEGKPRGQESPAS